MDPSRAQMHFMLDRQRMRREMQEESYEEVRTREAVVPSGVRKSQGWSVSPVHRGKMFMRLVYSIAFGKFGRSKQTVACESESWFS